MDNTGFDITRWDHWLLVASFGAIALMGLWLSWQWKKAQYRQQQKSKLARQLSLELYHNEVHREAAQKTAQKTAGQRALSERTNRLNISRSGRYESNERRTSSTHIRPARVRHAHIISTRIR